MQGRRLLVIDDSTTLRKVAEIAMRGTGCEVDFAANGGDGVALARARVPDVVLLDYLLPDLRSVEVCEQLRADPATAAVPVMIMSANARNVMDDFRQLATVVGFIAKPFTPIDLRSRLESAIRAAPRAEAAARPAVVASRGPGPGLELRGDLAATPIIELLRLLAATHATGALVVADRGGAPVGSAAEWRGGSIEHAARIWLRRGEIVVASSAHVAWDALAGSLGDALTPALRERLTRNFAAGKPIAVSLAEAGLAPVANLPLALHAASTQVLGALFEASAGRFVWEPAAALPDFVEAFGRHVSLTALALEHGRRAAAANAPGVLDRVYDRTPRFSDRLAGAQLDAEEQRVLASLDGRTSGRELAGRVRLTVDRVAAILTRLGAARLIGDGHASLAAAARRLAVLDADHDDFVAPLRARLGRRMPPIEVLELDPAQPLAAATLAHPADLVLVGVAALTRHVLDHELPALARDRGVAVICVLDAPDDVLSGQLLRAGLHAVISKPVHFDELERLLPV